MLLVLPSNLVVLATSLLFTFTSTRRGPQDPAYATSILQPKGTRKSTGLFCTRGYVAVLEISNMDDDNMGFLPNLPSYDPNINYDTSTSDYWQQSFAQQHDPQPTHAAPFFETQQDVYLTGNQEKSTSMFTFTGAPSQTYRSHSTNTVPPYAPSGNLAQKPKGLRHSIGEWRFKLTSP